MSAKQRPQIPHQRKKSEQTQTVDVLAQFHCENLIYDFDIPIERFNTRAFSKKTGIGKGEHWSAILASESSGSGYHVHFKGSIESKHVHLTIEYWEGPVKRTDEHPEPSSESIMRWVGTFIRDPGSRASVFTRFEKPNDSWRSRFNLPFKVTMAGVEVVIDGVSLVLPKNQFRALNGWLTQQSKTIAASMSFVRPVEFSKFSIGDDLVSFNEAIKMIVEPVV